MKNRNPMHDNWGTPKELYNDLNKEFNFDFDPCPLNHTIDGLSLSLGAKVILLIRLIVESSKKPLSKRRLRKAKRGSYASCCCQFLHQQGYSMRSFIRTPKYAFCVADPNLSASIQRALKYQTRPDSTTA